MNFHFDIKPYIATGELRFGMRKEEVEKVLGPADKSKKTSLNETKEFRQESGLQTVYSQTDNRLLEISFYPNIPNVKFKERDIFSGNGTDIVKFLINEDGNPFETVGILVFLNLGISMTGFLQEDEPSQKSISIFAKGRWDDDMEDLEPFSLA
jgi:hypothetical protein